MKIKHIQWLYHADSVTIRKYIFCDFPYLRILMYGINYFHIGITFYNFFYCRKHMIHWLSNIFSPMCCQKKQPAITAPFQILAVIFISDSIFQCIDCCISSYINMLYLFSFLQQLLFCQLCWCKIDIRNQINTLPVKFFRKRRL